MKTKFFLTLLIASSHFPVAAENSHYDEFLLAAHSDVEAEYRQHRSLDMNVIGSWVDDAQFRFNTATPADNLDIKKNQLSYELRIKPKAWGQRAIEKDIIKLRGDQQDNSYNQLLISALQKRYFRLLDYFEQGYRLQNLLETIALLKQETALIQSQVSSDQFKPEKLLEVEEALKQNQDVVKLYLVRLNTIQSDLGFPLDTLNSIETTPVNDRLVTVAEINHLIASISEENQSAPDVLNARLNLKLSQSENQLVKTKQQLGINFLKFEYGDRENDELAFQIGINIPLGTRFNESENQYNLSKAETQLHTTLVKNKLLLTEISRKIAWLSENWQLVRLQIERGQKHLQKDYAKTNPLIMINLRKAIIQNKQKKADLNQKMLNLFVSHLTLSGQLIHPPLRNWIQQGTPLLTHRQAN